jgi:hypothetical protein
MIGGCLRKLVLTQRIPDSVLMFFLVLCQMPNKNNQPNKKIYIFILWYHKIHFLPP